MKPIVIAAALTLATASSASAQSYLVSQYPAPYSALTGGSVASFVNLDDDVLQLPIGFTFRYFGVDYTHVNVSTNGVLVFASTCQTLLDCPFGFNNLCVSGRCLIEPNFSAPGAGMPSTVNPDQIIAVWWDDIHLSGGAVRYEIQGAAPNRRFVVQYENVLHVPDTTLARANFQVILEETSGTVTLHYGPFIANPNGNQTYSGTIGIEDEDGVEGYIALPCSNMAPNFCPYTALQGLTNQVVQFVVPNGPELVVSGVAPTGGAASSAIAIDVTARNLGPASTGAGFTADVYFSTDDIIEATDTYLGTVSFPAVGPQSNATQTLNATVPAVGPGYYSIGAIVDPADAVIESVETNNVGRFTDRFLVGSDFSILPTAPATAGPGGMVSIPVQITNNGSANSAVAYAVYFSTDTTLDASDLLLGTATVAVPAQPQTDYTIDVTVPSNVTSGNHYVIARVDPGDRIAEADETNNVGVSVGTTEIRLADIIAVSVSAVDVFLFRGRGAMITATITNAGGAPANGFHYALYLSDNQLISALSDSLLGEYGPVNVAAGNSLTVTHTVTVPAALSVGPYYLGLIANTLSSVDEDNPNNNIARTATPITVRDPAPDFTVERIRTPPTGAPAESMPVARVILNRGNAAGSTGYEVYLSTDRTIDSASDVRLAVLTTSIAAGQGNEGIDLVAVPPGLDAGPYYVGYLMDPSFSIDELFEDNNVGVSSDTVTIVSSPLVILTDSLPLGTLGVSYDVVLAARGGSGMLTWSLDAGVLPTGITLEADGRLHGVPEEEGLFPITVEVTDSRYIRSKLFNLLIAPTNEAVAIITRSLPPGFVGRAYEYPLTAFGGVPPYVWSEQSADDLPDGLTLNPEGVIRGVPTVPALATLNFRVTDATGAFAEFPLSLRVVTSGDTVRFSFELLPDGRLDELYDETLRVEMGTGVSPFTYTVISGALPDGIDHTRGRLFGTPRLVGDFSFAMRVDDARGDFDVNRFIIRIGEQRGVSFSTVSLPVGYVGEPYLDDDEQPAAIRAIATDDTERPELSIVFGTLPNGLTMSSDGVISGTPSSAGIFSFTVVARDKLGQDEARAYGISVTQRPVPPMGTDDGCGCRATERTGSTWSLLALLAVLLVRRRRLRAGLVLVLFLASPRAEAQTYVTEVETAPYVALSNATVAAFPGSDDAQVQINLPFNFSFYSNDYSSVQVSTNGYVTFGSDGSTFVNTGLPNTATPNNLIAVVWDDLTAGSVDWAIQGLAPNRVVIIQYRVAHVVGVPQSGTPQVQLRLYEGPTGRFEIHYGAVLNMTDPISWRATVGFENATGTEGVELMPCSPLCTGNQLVTLENRIYRQYHDGGMDLIASGIAIPTLVYEGVPFAVDVEIGSAHENPLGPFVFDLELVASGQATGPVVYTSPPTTIDAFDRRTISATVSVPLNTPTARYRLRAVIDSSNVITEPDETNNTVLSAAEFEIAPRRPDFAVRSVVGTPSRAAPGAAIDVELVIDNRGNLDGQAAWRLVWSENQVISHDDEQLAAGMVLLPLLSTATIAQQVTLPVNTIAGRYYLGVIVDPDNTVLEINEVNNAGAAGDFTTVVVEGLTVSTTSLPNAYVNVPYSTFLFATGGDGTYGWSIETGQLPDGLLLIPSTGEIRGRATTVTTQTFTVQVRSGTASATQSLMLVAAPIQAGLAIVTNSLLPAVVGAAYPPAPPGATPDTLQRIAAAGGAGSYRFQLASMPPPGLSLDPSGLLSGVAQQAGTYQLDVEVDDGIDKVTKQLPLTVAEPGRLTLVASLLPPGRIGEAYTYQLRVIGNVLTATVTFMTLGQQLPDGILLSPDGRLVGIPQNVGTRQFIVRASEGSWTGATEDTASYRLEIQNGGGFAITPTTIPTGVVGKEYQTKLTTRGGEPPYVWRLLGPALHLGVMWTVENTTGADTMTIGGTPKVLGVVSVLATVTDARGRFARQPLTLVVDIPTATTAPINQGCGCRTDEPPGSRSNVAWVVVLFGLAGAWFQRRKK